jgi:heat-inducible transcriptional repressor
MNKRKELILNIIIKDHIKTGAPVGSGVVVDRYQLGVSPATVRNEMAELEKEGYITQPHTSAGRVPTAKAYNHYLQSLASRKLKNEERRELDQALKDKDETGYKSGAKLLARLSGNAVFWAFHRHNYYYTGISNLFMQPEFTQVSMVYNISAVIDRMDEIIDEMYNNMNTGVRILIGSGNPFGDHCGAILGNYYADNKTGLFGILGPMRMDYAKNLSLVNYVAGALNK